MYKLRKICYLKSIQIWKERCDLESNIAKNFLFDMDSYILEIGNMIVEIKYSDNNKSLKECIENILERKLN